MNITYLCADHLTFVLWKESVMNCPEGTRTLCRVCPVDIVGLRVASEGKADMDDISSVRVVDSDADNHWAFLLWI